MATTANDMSTDDQILRQLNDDYIHSDQNSDVARYEEFLAEDFTATPPRPGLPEPAGVPRPHRPAARSPVHRYLPATQRKWMCVAGEIVAKGE
jgi:hypothetical protein